MLGLSWLATTPSSLLRLTMLARGTRRLAGLRYQRRLADGAPRNGEKSMNMPEVPIPPILPSEDSWRAIVVTHLSAAIASAEVAYMNLPGPGPHQPLHTALSHLRDARVRLGGER